MVGRTPAMTALTSSVASPVDRHARGQPVAIAVVLVVLAAANLLNNDLAVPAYVATSLVAAAVLLLVYRFAGGGWDQAGLGRGSLRRGARWAAGLTAAVAVGYVAAAVLPATRGVFLDPRIEPAGAAVIAFQVLVRIPLGTVLLEEVAFRGVLYGLVRRAGAAWATTVSCALFALWHVPPALRLAAVEPGFASGLPVAVAVMVAMAGAVLAGLVLCEVRRRSGSLLAPAGLHWAVNALGYLTATAVLGGR